MWPYVHPAGEPDLGREHAADRQLDRRLEHLRHPRRRHVLHAERVGHQHTVTAGTRVSVWVGATVSPAAAQAAGAYTGVVTMSAVYY